MCVEESAGGDMHMFMVCDTVIKVSMSISKSFCKAVIVLNI